MDDLFPELDITFPLSQIPAGTLDTTMNDLSVDWTSTLQPKPQSQSMLTPNDTEAFNDIDLGLDLGDDVGFDGNDTSISIQMGRTAPAPRPIGEDLFSENPIMEDDLPLDIGDDVQMNEQPASEGVQGKNNIDKPMANLDLRDDETLQLHNAQRRRESESPLSEAGSDVLRNLDGTFLDHTEVEEVAAQQPQRSKKRKPVVADIETMLHNKQIKAQAEDRSKILGTPNFLPHDPLLLTLMNMQKSGMFVSSVMNDGRSRNWAPELQGLLSFDAVRRSGDLKRKRDSGIADMGDDDNRGDKSPRLKLAQTEEEHLHMDEGFGGDSNIDLSRLDVPGEESNELRGEDPLDETMPGEEAGIFADEAGFDDTTMPLVHPADSGPVSMSTKHAVHILRERFGGQNQGISPSQSKKSVLLQELVPENRTSKEAATKMFFEVLVLATKDAIKVEQAEKAIGLPLRIRGKRGLWGSWAETSLSEDPNAINHERTAIASYGV